MEAQRRVSWGRGLWTLLGTMDAQGAYWTWQCGGHSDMAGAACWDFGGRRQELITGGAGGRAAAVPGRCFVDRESVEYS